MITLKKISILDPQMETCIALDVTKEQKNFVASNAISLAEAYDANKYYEKNYPVNGKGDVAVPYAVYENNIMVGFVMYGYFPPQPDESPEDEYCPEEHIYYVWRLLIDKNHQRKGIGAEVVRQIMDEIKTKPCGEANYCYVSYEPNNIGSQTTFKNYGFTEDGRIIEGETVAVYNI